MAVLAQEHIAKQSRDEDGLQNLQTMSTQERGVLHTPAERDLISRLLVAVGIFGLRFNSFWTLGYGPFHEKLGAKAFLGPRPTISVSVRCAVMRKYHIRVCTF